MSAEPTSGEAQGSSPTYSRRSLLKAGAAAGAGTAFMGSGSTLSPIGEADALVCGGLCVGAIAVGTAGSAVAAGWMLREEEVIGKDDPPQGVTGDALQNEAYNTAQTRKSNNASTFVDNRNILDGAKHVAYADGKIAGIEALNAQETQSTVTSDGQAAVDTYETTITSNLLKSWRESVQEFESLVTAVSDHPDLNEEDVFPTPTGLQHEGWTFPTTTHTLPDGSTIDIPEVSIEMYEGGLSDGQVTAIWSPLGYREEEANSGGTVGESNAVVSVSYDGSTVEYLPFEGWNAVFSKIGTLCTEVRDGISTWVDGVYSQVQAGDLNTEDLLTPRELAELSATEEEGFNQAIADLLALNIPIDLEREAEINIPSAGTTLYGLLGVTSEVTLNAGDSIDPSTVSEDYYLTYDTSEANGDWTAFETAVDGGIVTFTEEPHPGVLYNIQTTAGESAEVPSDDFTETDAGGAWEADISGKVETAITEVDSVQFYSGSDETNNVTVHLDEPFEIVGWTDSEGNDVDSVDYSPPSQPETDSNYITEEQWQERKEEYEALIEKYKEETSGGGGGLLPDFGLGGLGSGIGGLVTLGVVGWVAAQLLGSQNS